jgi:hypothetical protein
MEAQGARASSSGLGFSFGTYNISTGSLDGTKKILTLIIAETGLPDTNAVPALTYTSTGPRRISGTSTTASTSPRPSPERRTAPARHPGNHRLDSTGTAVPTRRS